MIGLDDTVLQSGGDIQLAGFGFENEVALEFVERYKLRGKEQALSAEELTRAFAEDREGATKKYLNKNLIVEGVVDSREEFKVMLRGYTPAK